MDKLKDLNEGDLLEITTKTPINRRFKLGDVVRVLSFDTDDWYGDRTAAFCELMDDTKIGGFVAEGEFKRVVKENK